MFKLKTKGFTLIELLVVIAIIAILAILIIVGLNASRSRARDSRRKQDLRSVQTGLAIYYDNEDMYPFAYLGEEIWQYSNHDGKYGLEDVAKEMDFQSGVLPHDPFHINSPGTCNNLPSPYSYKSCDYGYRIGFDISWNELTDGYVLGARLESGDKPPGEGATKCDDASVYNYCISDYVEGMILRPVY